MSTAKKIFTCLLILLSLVLFSVLFGFVLYKSASFPDFNRIVDEILSNYIPSISVEETVVIEEDFKQEIQPALFNVLDKNPILYEIDSSKILSLKDSVEDFSISVSWNYPIVSKPVSFSDAIVFVDARPCVVMLDVNTNALLKEIPCGVYPSENAFVKDFSYYFESRSGLWYELKFSDEIMQNTDSIEPLMIPKDNSVQINQLLEKYVFPTEEIFASINEKMSSLFSSEVNKINDIQLYLEEDGIVTFNRQGLSPLFVFSPEEQGSYVIGLCDNDGVWIRDNAFVTLFSKTGETRAVSLDYVADRPQITIHLSDAELYYICVGFMDLTEGNYLSNFQIKKAP